MATADAAAALSKYNVQRTLVKLASIPAVATAITYLPLTLQGAIYDVGTGLLTFINQSDVEPAIETLDSGSIRLPPLANADQQSRQAQPDACSRRPNRGPCPRRTVLW
jgi:hypothetical protein